MGKDSILYEKKRVDDEPRRIANFERVAEIDRLRLKQRHEQHNDICTAIVGTLTDLALKVVDYRENNNREKMPPSFWREYKADFVADRPLQLDDLGAPLLEKGTTDMVANASDDVDVQELLDCHGKWALKESTTDRENSELPNVSKVFRELEGALRCSWPLTNKMLQTPRSPCIISLVGPPLSGKTTLANTLALKHRLAIITPEDIVKEAQANESTYSTWQTKWDEICKTTETQANEWHKKRSAWESLKPFDRGLWLIEETPPSIPVPSPQEEYSMLLHKIYELAQDPSQENPTTEQNNSIYANILIAKAAAQKIMLAITIANDISTKSEKKCEDLSGKVPEFPLGFVLDGLPKTAEQLLVLDYITHGPLWRKHIPKGWDMETLLNMYKTGRWLMPRQLKKYISKQTAVSKENDETSNENNETSNENNETPNENDETSKANDETPNENDTTPNENGESVTNPSIDTDVITDFENNESLNSLTAAHPILMCFRLPSQSKSNIDETQLKLHILSQRAVLFNSNGGRMMGSTVLCLDTTPDTDDINTETSITETTDPIEKSPTEDTIEEEAKDTKEELPNKNVSEDVEIPTKDDNNNIVDEKSEDNLEDVEGNDAPAALQTAPNIFPEYVLRENIIDMLSTDKEDKFIPYPVAVRSSQWDDFESAVSEWISVNKCTTFLPENILKKSDEVGDEEDILAAHQIAMIAMLGAAEITTDSQMGKDVSQDECYTSRTVYRASLLRIFATREQREVTSAKLIKQIERVHDNFETVAARVLRGIRQQLEESNMHMTQAFRTFLRFVWHETWSHGDVADAYERIMDAAKLITSSGELPSDVLNGVKSRLEEIMEDIWDAVHRRQIEAEQELNRLEHDGWEISVGSAIAARLERLVSSRMAVWDESRNVAIKYCTEIESSDKNNSRLSPEPYCNIIKIHDKTMSNFRYAVDSLGAVSPDEAKLLHYLNEQRDFCRIVKRYALQVLSVDSQDMVKNTSSSFSVLQCTLASENEACLSFLLRVARVCASIIKDIDNQWKLRQRQMDKQIGVFVKREDDRVREVLETIHSAVDNGKASEMVYNHLKSVMASSKHSSDAVLTVTRILHLTNAFCIESSNYSKSSGLMGILPHKRFKNVLANLLPEVSDAASADLIRLLDPEDTGTISWRQFIHSTLISTGILPSEASVDVLLSLKSEFQAKATENRDTKISKRQFMDTTFWFENETSKTVAIEIKKVYFSLFSVSGEDTVEYRDLLLQFCSSPKSKSVANVNSPNPRRSRGLFRAFLLFGLEMRGHYIQWKDQSVSKEILGHIIQTHKYRGPGSKMDMKQRKHFCVLDILFPNADSKVTFKECCSQFEEKPTTMSWMISPIYDTIDIAAMLAHHGVW